MVQPVDQYPLYFFNIGRYCSGSRNQPVDQTRKILSIGRYSGLDFGMDIVSPSVKSNHQDMQLADHRNPFF